MLNRFFSLLVLTFFGSSVCFALAGPVFQGDEVVVTALRAPRLESTIPWNTEVITRDEIERSSAVNLRDLLRSSSGLQVTAQGWLGGQASLQIRGSQAGHVLVLLDGKRIDSPTLGQTNFGDILLTDVEKVEIVKSPLTPLYGAGAAGGVVNIITRRPIDNDLTEIETSYGEFGTRNISLFKSGERYTFSSSRIDSAGLNNLKYGAENHSLRFFSDLGPANYELSARYFIADKNLSAVETQKEANAFYDLTYQAPALGLKVDAAYNIQDQTYTGWGVTRTKTASSLLEVEWSNKYLLAGFETKTDNSDGTISGLNQIRNQAVFVQDQVQLNDRLGLVLGAREDITPAFGQYFNPRVGLVYQHSADTVFKTSWGSSFKSPTINQLYWTSWSYTNFSGGISTTEGNPALRPESASTIDLTVEKRLGSGGQGRLSFYRSELTDLIDWANTSLSPVDELWTPSNIANARIDGLELSWQNDWAERWSGRINYTCQDARNTQTGKSLPSRPGHQGGASFGFHNGGFLSELAYRYVGNRFADTNERQIMPSHGLVDLSCAWQFTDWRVKLTADNLLDTRYEETRLYPMPGRRYNVTVAYRFE